MIDLPVIIRHPTTDNENSVARSLPFPMPSFPVTWIGENFVVKVIINIYFPFLPAIIIYVLSQFTNHWPPTMLIDSVFIKIPSPYLNNHSSVTKLVQILDQPRPSHCLATYQSSMPLSGRVQESMSWEYQKQVRKHCKNDPSTSPGRFLQKMFYHKWHYEEHTLMVTILLGTGDQCLPYHTHFGMKSRGRLVFVLHDAHHSGLSIG